MNKIKYIESSQNKDYKYWQILAKSKQNKNDLSILIEGDHLCRAWLLHKGEPKYMLIDEVLLDSGKYSDLWSSCDTSKKIILKSNLAKSLVQVKNGLGLFFIVDRPVLTLPSSLETDLVCLDRVQDPGNLGTLLRTTAAAGIKHVALSVGCASAWSAKSLRSAQGAHFALSIFENIDLASYLATIDLNVCSTSLDQASDLYKTDLMPNTAWIFGNEGQGVSADLLKICSTKVRIPQSDQVESLNVAAAAAVCLFEQLRQRLNY